MRRKPLIASTFAALLGALVAGQVLLERSAEAQDGARRMAPVFEVDPFWPKPLPAGSKCSTGAAGRQQVSAVCGSVASPISVRSAKPRSLR